MTWACDWNTYEFTTLGTMSYVGTYFVFPFVYLLRLVLRQVDTCLVGTWYAHVYMCMCM